MTYREKVLQDYPGIEQWWLGCPYHYGYEKQTPCDFKQAKIDKGIVTWEGCGQCKQCWDREVNVGV